MKTESFSRFESAREPSPWLFRYAFFVACCTFALIFAGGLVTSKGAGLAVPDWPLSYGSLNPPGWFHVENVRAEHGHRLIAGTVGILYLILTIWIWRVEPRRWVRNVALVALLAVIAQAILGGITVKFFLPTPISVSHATLGQTFFCLTVALAIFLSPHWQVARERVIDTSPLPFHYLALGLVLILYVQLVLGAVMRHTESGLAILDFPLSYGNLVPPTDPEILDAINRDRRWEYNLPEVTAAQMMIHFSHRLGAVAVVAYAIWIGVQAIRKYRNENAILFPVLLIWGLLAFQVMLGILTIYSMKQPHITTTHVAIGAASLAAAWALMLESFRNVGRPAEVEARRPKSAHSAREAALS